MRPCERRLATELRTNFLADKLQVYHDAIDCALRLGRVDLAFGYLERAKSRALVDYLTGTPRYAPGPAADPTRRSPASWRACARSTTGSMTGLDRARPGRWRAGPGADEGGEPGLEEAIRDREKRIARLRERLALREEAAGTWTGRSSPCCRPPLGDADVLVEYYLTAAAPGPSS